MTPNTSFIDDADDDDDGNDSDGVYDDVDVVYNVNDGVSDDDNNQIDDDYDDHVNDNNTVDRDYGQQSVHTPLTSPTHPDRPKKRCRLSHLKVEAKTEVPICNKLYNTNQPGYNKDLTEAKLAC